jgi:UDP-3-O-[3-hydroxymyristoyl] glucosamine N-acyltransferase
VTQKPEPEHTVGDIVEFLSATGESTSRWHLPESLRLAPVHGVRPDVLASPGEASWVSESTHRSDPERIVSFGGSLLITPPLTDIPKTVHAIVPCTRPKLAFSRMLMRFFPTLAAVSWPEAGLQVSDRASVDPSVQLAPGVVIGSGTTIAAGTVIGPNTVIANAVIGPRVTIGANCSIGLPGFGFERDATGRYTRFPHVGRVVIQHDVEIGSNTCLDRGTLGDTTIGAYVKIDNLVHVAHNVTIGDNSLLIAHAMIGGSVSIGRDVWCAPAASLKNKLVIGDGALIGLGAVVVKSVESGATVVGNPARPFEKQRQR